MTSQVPVPPFLERISSNRHTQPQGASIKKEGIELTDHLVVLALGAKLRWPRINPMEPLVLAVNCRRRLSARPKALEGSPMTNLVAPDFSPSSIAHSMSLGVLQ